ncbi:helix-turn-helix transcriptional regulator [Brevibacillus formosus]|uniref:helix-turn-helix domain-containing protein n=1 Tax=Brevibacillus formosus TaxID=54913 RepID=UPI003D24CCE3
MGQGKTVQRSLRSEVEHHLKERGYTLTKLGEITGINQGVLSDILNRTPSRAMTIGHLDALAVAFNQAPGWLYEMYVTECIVEGRVSRSRVVPYLVRCAEIGRHDCIELIVPKLLDNQKNLSILFSVAEKLFTNGKRQESIPFYQLVIESEKDSHCDRFVMSQYRLFRAMQGGADSEKKWKAVIRFHPYRNRLPENYQLDALLQLANVCFTLHNWKEVERYADELRELATLIYNEEVQRWEIDGVGGMLETERHLVVYYGQGFLLKGLVLQLQERYEEAISYVQAYAELGWFEFRDGLAEMEIEKFRRWAKANNYTLNLLMGRTELLSDYVNHLANNPSEILAGMFTIMETANRFGLSVDNIVERFSKEIACFQNYKDPFSLTRHLHFRYHLAIYQLDKGRVAEGITETLRCLALASRMMEQEKFQSCVAMFWKYRHSASDQQIDEFQNILEGRNM